ncbi:DNA topoisomerase 3 [Paenibacillus sp. p3-SID1389]|uniref:type IA DNA topoisomerase n=1 Tax=Paenibacillus sp. p3-SID1389 TaxID=2916364 RepID=UPI0021A3D829|nr:type IA DNA topoisomerase [Paenibacillus sp. p3-SID1389]MCT2194575.1 DNA topoisomerase 3 [Paenibacillus sp. p3-SID1389]
MKTLVIAEKPDMGRTIAAVIEPKAKNNRSYLEGERYIITWAIGHLLGLAEPDAYDEKYKRWNFNDLPILPDRFKIVPNPRTKDQLKTIGELAKRCNMIVNACDAAREGQYIFALIQQQLKLTQPVKRLWISDLTNESIAKGFAELHDASEFENLTQAARARSEADWLIGMNATRAFTTKHRELLSVGRVQTPVLALIYDRQKEIENFDSLTYYEIKAEFEQDTRKYTGSWQGDRMTDKEKAEAIATKVRGKEGRITEYEVKETKEYPYKLYDLTLLQREANAKFGYSAKKTLDIAQALYERHKVISYPRTSSNYVTEQNIDGMHKVLHMLKSSSYKELAEGGRPNLVHVGNKAVCNPSRVEDHHAILPTLRRPGTLSKEEQNIYDLVIRRFLSHFYPAAEYKQHTVLTEVEGETFKTNVKELLSLGWKVCLPGDDGAKAGKGRGKKKDEEDETEELISEPFEIDRNRPVQCTGAEAKEKATQPPKHYTEGTLLKAMESAGKNLENEELREAMKDAGLGTPATRAATIERLKNVGYITMQGKKITVTQKGRTAVELIRRAGVELLTSPEMTGQWERRLYQISKGEAAREQFMENVRRFTISIIEKVRTQQKADASMFATAETEKGNRRGSRSSSGGKTGRSAAASGASERRTAQAAAKQLPAGSLQPLAPCPREGCGGQIIEGRKGYGCTHYKQGCGFVIWKEFGGKKISPAMLNALLTKGQTQLLSFKREGGEVKARISLVDRTTGKLELMEAEPSRT